MIAVTAPAHHFKLVLGLAACAGLAGLATLAAPPPPGKQAFASSVDIRPGGAPSDAAYRAALQMGLEGDLPGGRRAMEAIAAERPGTNRSAWALYQARQAARLSRDAEGAASLERRLRIENPSHPLVARLDPDAPPPPPVRAALADCGPRSLAHFASVAGKPVDLAKVRQLCGTDDSGTTMLGLARAARRLGFDARPLQVDRWYLERESLSGIAWADGNHYIAFGPAADSAAARSRFTVFDPNDAAEVELTASELHRRSQGILLVLEPTAGPAGADRR